MGSKIDAAMAAVLSWEAARDCRRMAEEPQYAAMQW